MCKTDNQWESAIRLRDSNQDSRVRRVSGIKKGEDIYIYMYVYTHTHIPMVDSCWCMAEANTILILWGDFPSIKFEKKLHCFPLLPFRTAERLSSNYPLCTTLSSPFPVCKDTHFFLSSFPSLVDLLWESN